MFLLLLLLGPTICIYCSAVRNGDVCFVFAGDEGWGGDDEEEAQEGIYTMRKLQVWRGKSGPGMRSLCRPPPPPPLSPASLDLTGLGLILDGAVVAFVMPLVWCFAAVDGGSCSFGDGSRMQCTSRWE